MNGVGGIGPGSQEPQFPPEEGITQGLSKEVLDKILSSLAGSDYKSYTQGKPLNMRAVLESGRTQQADQIEKTCKEWSSILQESHPQEAKLLSEIGSPLPVIKSVNFLALKTNSSNVQEQILNILQRLPEDAIEKLEQSSSNIPLFFENVFALARVYKLIDSDPIKRLAEEGKVNLTRDVKAAQGAVDQLLEMGNTDKAIRFVTSRIQDPKTSLIELNRIISYLTSNGKYQEALSATNMIKSNPIKNQMLAELGSAAARAGEFPFAELLRPEITDPTYLDQLDFTLSVSYSGSGNFARALPLALDLPDGSQLQKTALARIGHQMIEQGNGDEAQKLAEQIRTTSPEAAEEINHHIENPSWWVQ